MRKIFSSHWSVSLPPTKAIFLHGVGCSVRILEVTSDFRDFHFWFSWSRGLRSTQTSTLIIFGFQFSKRCKKHFKDQPFTFQKDGAPSYTSIKYVCILQTYTCIYFKGKKYIKTSSTSATKNVLLRWPSYKDPSYVKLPAPLIINIKLTKSKQN